MSPAQVPAAIRLGQQFSGCAAFEGSTQRWSVEDYFENRHAISDPKRNVIVRSHSAPSRM